MIQQQLEKAAQEARIATAMTLTPRGTHSSIDDIPFVEKQITFDEVAESAFVKGGEYALSHQWVNVKERKPEAYTCVLVYCVDGARYLGYYDEQSWCIYGLPHYEQPAEVGYWMSIPKPPTD